MPKHDNPFDWSGGHPALDLVNTLDERPSSEPVENLTDYGDLVRFTELAGLIDPLTSQRLRLRDRPARELPSKLVNFVSYSTKCWPNPTGIG